MRFGHSGMCLRNPMLYNPISLLNWLLGISRVGSAAKLWRHIALFQAQSLDVLLVQGHRNMASIIQHKSICEWHRSIVRAVRVHGSTPVVLVQQSLEFGALLSPVQIWTPSAAFPLWSTLTRVSELGSNHAGQGEPVTTHHQSSTAMGNKKARNVGGAGLCCTPLQMTCCPLVCLPRTSCHHLCPLLSRSTLSFPTKNSSLFIFHIPALLLPSWEQSALLYSCFCTCTRRWSWR